MEATHDDVRFAVDAPSGGIIDADRFPRPFTIYAGNVEDVSLDRLPLDNHNDRPKLFMWTAKAADILEKVKHARKALDNRYSA